MQTPATRGARPTKGSKEEVNITRISFCAVDVFPVGAFVDVDQDRREKAGLLPRAGRGPGTAQNQSI